LAFYTDKNDDDDASDDDEMMMKTHLYREAYVN